MKLRLAATSRDATELRNLFVFVAFHIVQHENLSSSGR
jgi:hypothetical protein